MLDVRPATDAMTDAIVALLAKFQNPDIDAVRWRRLLTYPWRRPDEAPGFVLCAAERVVGFLGTVHSTLRAAGETHRVCHLAAWITDAAHRTGGAHLMREALGLERTLVNMTPVPALARFLVTQGFRTLEDRAIVFDGARGWCPPWRRSRIVTDADEMAAILDADGQRLLRDHYGYPCVQCVAVRGRSACPVLYTIRPAGGTRTAWLHHAGDLATFLASLPAFARHVARVHGVDAIAVESRMLRGWRPRRFREQLLETPRVYRACGLAAEAISNAYSEIPLLGL